MVAARRQRAWIVVLMAVWMFLVGFTGSVVSFLVAASGAGDDAPAPDEPPYIPYILAEATTTEPKPVLETAEEAVPEPAIEVVEAPPPVAVAGGERFYIPGLPDEVVEHIWVVSRRYDLDPYLIVAIGHVESSWRLHVRGAAGEYGPLQVMPATARELGVKNLEDWRETLEAGAAYLAKMLIRANGDLDLALAYYNAGPSRGPTLAKRYAGSYPDKVRAAYERFVR